MDIMRRIFSKKEEIIEETSTSTSTSTIQRPVEEMLEQDILNLREVSNEIEKYEKTIVDHQQKIDVNNNQIKLLDTEISKFDDIDSRGYQFKEKLKLQKDLNELNMKIEQLKSSEEISLTLDKHDLLKNLRKQQLLVINDINTWNNAFNPQDTSLTLVNLREEKTKIYTHKKKDLINKNAILMNKLNELIKEITILESQQITLKKNILKYRAELNQDSSTPCFVCQ